MFFSADVAKGWRPSGEKTSGTVKGCKADVTVGGVGSSNIRTERWVGIYNELTLEMR